MIPTDLVVPLPSVWIVRRASVAYRLSFATPLTVFPSVSLTGSWSLTASPTILSVPGPRTLTSIAIISFLGVWATGTTTTEDNRTLIILSTKRYWTLGFMSVDIYLLVTWQNARTVGLRVWIPEKSMKVKRATAHDTCPLSTMEQIPWPSG